MSRSRRLSILILLALVAFTVVTVGAAHATLDATQPVDALFGLVELAPVFEPDDVPLPADPFLSVRGSRGPPRT